MPGFSRFVLLPVFLFVSAAVGAAEQFALRDLNGDLQRLSDYRGKWVVVNYWATWCPPCLEEIPELVMFHERHKDTDAVVLGVNFEDISEEELRQFVEDYFVSYPILPAEPSGKTPFGSLLGLPTTYIIGPDGELVKQHIGGVDQAMLEQIIQSKVPARTQSVQAR